MEMMKISERGLTTPRVGSLGDLAGGMCSVSTNLAHSIIQSGGVIGEGSGIGAHCRARGDTSAWPTGRVRTGTREVASCVWSTARQAAGTVMATEPDSSGIAGDTAGTHRHRPERV